MFKTGCHLLFAVTNLPGFGIFQSLKGNKLNSANSEQKTIYIPLVVKVLIK